MSVRRCSKAFCLRCPSHRRKLARLCRKKRAETRSTEKEQQRNCGDKRMQNRKRTLKIPFLLAPSQGTDAPFRRICGEKGRGWSLGNGQRQGVWYKDKYRPTAGDFWTEKRLWPTRFGHEPEIMAEADAACSMIAGMCCWISMWAVRFPRL